MSKASKAAVVAGVSTGMVVLAWAPQAGVATALATVIGFSAFGLVALALLGDP